MKTDNFLDSVYNFWQDQKWHIKTCQQVAIYNLDIREASIVNGRRYQGTHYRLLKKIFKGLDIKWDEWNFVDFGSGKGRALIFASLMGFREVIGVEFARDLCQEAKVNVLKFKEKFPRTSPINILNIDAKFFKPKAGRNVYFFFNPFDEVILSHVLYNIFAGSKQNNQDLFIYVNPRGASIFDSIGLKRTMVIDNLNFNKKVFVYQSSTT